ncbi:MAG: glycosyltransferase family 4 protein [Patescibacteria group bacterium]
MKILIVADVYPPEVSSAAHLMHELAHGLLRAGHSVSVLTSYPRHYLTEESKDKKFEIVSSDDGVTVIRIKTLPLHKVNFIIRGISQILLPIIFSLRVKKYMKESPDAVIIYSPPITLGLVGKFIKKRYGAKFLLNIQDIFPQNAIDLGILKNKPIIKFFELIEKTVYASADVITFHSDGGKKFLIEKKNVSEKKIVTLHNWVDANEYTNLKKDISFRDRYGLQGKFIFLFAGIMGPAQGLEFLAQVAERVSDLKDIVFLLVGDGTEKGKIERLIQEKNIKNIEIRPFISKDEYPYLVKDSDVGIVCLSSDNKTSFVPGKFLGYMAAGKPVVSFLNKESDAFALVKEAQCGYAGRSDDVEEGEKIIRKIYAEKQKLDEYGTNGLRFVKEHLTLEACVKKIEDLLKK